MKNTNGNDLELIIKFPKDGLEYYAPVQAKKTYRNELYASMEHGGQLKSLMRYAAHKKALPYYLLYNYSDRILNSLNEGEQKELSGCTLIDATYLHKTFYNKRNKHKKDGTITRAWKIPGFFDLHPSPAFAWHELVCQNSAIDLYNFLENNGLAGNKVDLNKAALKYSDMGSEKGFHPLDTHTPDNYWLGTGYNAPDIQEHNIANEFIYEYDTKNPKTANEIENNSTRFSPRSRIVITK